MIGRVLFFGCLFFVACGRDEAALDEHTGQIILERQEPRPARLGRLPASGAWCARDTTLSIVGSNESWSAAIALRLHWPVDSGAVVAVDSAHLGGKAGIAVRQLSDSIRTAIVAHTGTVTIEKGGRELAGRFELGSGADSTAVSLNGRFEGINVVSSCP